MAVLCKEVIPLPELFNYRGIEEKKTKKKTTQVATRNEKEISKSKSPHLQDFWEAEVKCQTANETKLQEEVC